MATTTIPTTALSNRRTRDHALDRGLAPTQAAPDFASAPPAVSGGFVAMATILSGFALFWLAAGFGLGYWVAG